MCTRACVCAETGTEYTYHGRRNDWTKSYCLYRFNCHCLLFLVCSMHSHIPAKVSTLCSLCSVFMDGMIIVMMFISSILVATIIFNHTPHARTSPTPSPTHAHAHAHRSHAHTVMCSAGVARWEVRKRFSDFVQLNAAFKSKQKVCAPMYECVLTSVYLCLLTGTGYVAVSVSVYMHSKTIPILCVCVCLPLSLTSITAIFIPSVSVRVSCDCV